MAVTMARMDVAETRWRLPSVPREMDKLPFPANTDSLWINLDVTAVPSEQTVLRNIARDDLCNYISRAIPMVRCDVCLRNVYRLYQEIVHEAGHFARVIKLSVKGCHIHCVL